MPIPPSQLSHTPRTVQGDIFFLTMRKPFDAFHLLEFLLPPPLPYKDIYKRQSYLDLFFFVVDFIFLTKTRISQML